MNKLKKKINKPIVGMFALILLYILLTIVVTLAIPYAIVRGACNIDYYEDWVNFLFKYIDRTNQK